MKLEDKILKNHENGFRTRQKQYQGLFNLDFWKNQESYKLIKQYTNKADKVIEIGCLTGHHLILLEQEGYKDLTGVDFVKDAIDWANDHSDEIVFFNSDFMDICFGHPFDKIILFDVIEHVANIGKFLEKIEYLLKEDSEVLILVPRNKHFFDNCHINFYPDEDCLRNLLQLYFKVKEIRIVDNDKKIFARCTK